MSGEDWDAMLAEAWAETAPPRAMTEQEVRAVSMHAMHEPQDLIQQVTGLDAAQVQEAVALCQAHTQRVAKATTTAARPARRARTARPARQDLAESPQVRLWAEAQGWQVPDVGRLPGAIVLAYKAARRAAC